MIASLDAKNLSEKQDIKETISFDLSSSDLTGDQKQILCHISKLKSSENQGIYFLNTQYAKHRV